MDRLKVLKQEFKGLWKEYKMSSIYSEHAKNLYTSINKYALEIKYLTDLKHYNEETNYRVLGQCRDMPVQPISKV